MPNIEKTIFYPTNVYYKRTGGDYWQIFKSDETTDWEWYYLETQANFILSNEESQSTIKNMENVSLSEIPNHLKHNIIKTEG